MYTDLNGELISEEVMMVKEILGYYDINYDSVESVNIQQRMNVEVRVTKHIGDYTITMAIVIPRTEMAHEDYHGYREKTMERKIKSRAEDFKEYTLRTSKFRKHDVRMYRCNRYVCIECKNCGEEHVKEIPSFKWEWEENLTETEKDLFEHYMLGNFDGRCYHSWRRHAPNSKRKT